MDRNFSPYMTRKVSMEQVNEVPSLSILILTYNEEKHIARCISSIKPICKEVFLIDSFSTDRTIEIAEQLGAKCYQHKWENNHALQFNWGLSNLPIKTDWIMRIDADEYILPELGNEILQKLDSIKPDISGIHINRRVIFMEKWIKRGGYYPVTLLRIWRRGSGMLEQRWMDEHVKLEWGGTIKFDNDLIDHNLNDLSWWTSKHNNYATREAIDFIIYKYNLGVNDSIGQEILGAQDKRKRWLKENIYFRIPLFVRPFLYFLVRYIFQLGILDGKQGLIWHYLQGFWYRFLVDAKIFEIYRKAGREKERIREYLRKEYSINI